MRLVVGLTLAAHGAQKLFRPAPPWAWTSALAEFLGGLGLALGLLIPLPSFAVLGAMLVAIALVHWPKGFFNTKGGFEFNLSIIAAIAAVALTGPGAYTLDAILLGTRKPQTAPENKTQAA